VLKPNLLLDCAHGWIFFGHANVLFELAAGVNLVVNECFFQADCFAFGQDMLSTAVKDANEATVSHTRFIFRMVAAIGFVRMGEDLITALANRIYLSTKYLDKKLGQTEFLS